MERVVSFLSLHRLVGRLVEWLWQSKRGNLCLWATRSQLKLSFNCDLTFFTSFAIELKSPWDMKTLFNYECNSRNNIYHQRPGPDLRLNLHMMFYKPFAPVVLFCIIRFSACLVLWCLHYHSPLSTTSNLIIIGVLCWSGAGLVTAAISVTTTTTTSLRNQPRLTIIHRYNAAMRCCAFTFLNALHIKCRNPRQLGQHGDRKLWN